MKNDPKDALARAVEKRRAAELRLLARDRARELREQRADTEARRLLDERRARLADLATTADPILRAWLDERLDHALRAFPRATRRSIELPALYITDRGPRFWHEPGSHRDARSHKRYVVAIGRELRLDWSASAPGGAGGGRVPIAPTSFRALAAIDLARTLEGWQVHDVLDVALRLAKLVAGGELEDLITGVIERRFERGQ